MRYITGAALFACILPEQTLRQNHPQIAKGSE